jgi:hypothetical protein
MRCGHFIMAIFCAWVLWDKQLDASQQTNAANGMVVMPFKAYNLIGATETKDKCDVWLQDASEGEHFIASNKFALDNRRGFVSILL